jgi:hypothetical protein
MSSSARSTSECPQTSYYAEPNEAAAGIAVQDTPQRTEPMQSQVGRTRLCYAARVSAVRR